MATYRTIRMSFWNDPAIENLPPADKLLYLYLFTCPHANNLGVLSVSLRKMAFETGLSEDAIRRGLAAFESSGRIVRDGGHVWVCGFIRHQCSTSPKILTSLRALFRSYPGRHSGTLPPPVRGRAVPFRWGIGTLRGIRKGIGKRRSDREAGGERSFLSA